jgi:hypothetical protein
MVEDALSLRERAEFLLRVASRASTPKARASLESLAHEYLRRADELEMRGQASLAFRSPQVMVSGKLKKPYSG